MLRVPGDSLFRRNTLPKGRNHRLRGFRTHSGPRRQDSVHRKGRVRVPRDLGASGDALSSGPAAGVHRRGRRGRHPPGGVGPPDGPGSNYAGLGPERWWDLCRRYLPNHHQGSFDDPRTGLFHQDARGFLAEDGEGYDVIILDLVDPLEGGTAFLLYTEEFYRIARARLNSGGVLVTQSGPARTAQPPRMLYHHLQYPAARFCPRRRGPSARSGLSDPLGFHLGLRLATSPGGGAVGR